MSKKWNCLKTIISIPRMGNIFLFSKFHLKLSVISGEISILKLCYLKK